MRALCFLKLQMLKKMPLLSLIFALWQSLNFLTKLKMLCFLNILKLRYILFFSILAHGLKYGFSLTIQCVIGPTQSLLCQGMLDFFHNSAHFLARATSLYKPYSAVLPACLSCNKFLGYVARRRTSSYGAVRLVLITPLNCWRNSTPF